MKRLFVLTVCLLSGCGWLHQDDGRIPAVFLPSSWQMPVTGETVNAAVGKRWHAFHDPQLTALLDEVLRRNNDLALAGFTLRQAWLDAGLAGAAGDPGFSASTTAANSQQVKPKREATESYQSSVSLSWELDLWGKLARQHDRAVWQAKASEMDRLATALSLINTTAEFYWSIALLNHQLAIVERQLLTNERIQALATARHRAGAADLSDIVQAEQSRQQLLANQTTLKKDRDSKRNALAILFDNGPAVHRRERHDLSPAGSVAAPEATPAGVLGSRPDIRKAEMTFRAALAGADVARLNFYPSLDLSFGMDAGNGVFQQWFSNPVRSVSLGVTQPFTQWQTVMLTVDRADIDVQAAEVSFRESVWKALSEIDDAVAARAKAQHQFVIYQRDIVLSETNARLAQSRYRNGSTDIQQWLEAEDATLDAEMNLQNANYDSLTATMTLWLSLGGGLNIPLKGE